MRRLGQLLMALGLGVGLLVALAMSVHAGLAGVPWLVNVALAKLGLVAAGGLMVAGAGSIRAAKRREDRQLAAPRQASSTGARNLLSLTSLIAAQLGGSAGQSHTLGCTASESTPRLVSRLDIRSDDSESHSVHQ